MVFELRSHKTPRDKQIISISSNYLRKHKSKECAPELKSKINTTRKGWDVIKKWDGRTSEIMAFL